MAEGGEGSLSHLVRTLAEEPWAAVAAKGLLMPPTSITYSPASSRDRRHLAPPLLRPSHDRFTRRHLPSSPGRGTRLCRLSQTACEGG